MKLLQDMEQDLRIQTKVRLLKPKLFYLEIEKYKKPIFLLPYAFSRIFFLRSENKNSSKVSSFATLPVFSNEREVGIILPL